MLPASPSLVCKPGCPQTLLLLWAALGSTRASSGHLSWDLPCLHVLCRLCG